MNAIYRFTLHTLLPPLGGGILILGALTLARSAPLSLNDALLGLVLGLFFAYVIALIPCLVYAAVMEFAARRGVRPGGGRAILLSASLGCLVGALPFLDPADWRHWPSMIFVPAVGFVVGLGVEWLIGCIARRCNHADAMQVGGW